MDEFDYDLAEDETEEEAMEDFYHYTLELHKDHGNYGSLSFETCTNGMCVMAREWKAQVEAAQHSVHLTASGTGGRGQNSLQSSFIADDPSAKQRRQVTQVR